MAAATTDLGPAPPSALPPAAPRAVAAERTSFIVSPGFDGFFFLGSSLVVLLAWVATVGFHVDPFHVLAAVAVTSNAPHLTSTWTRVYFDKEYVRTRPVAFFVMPAVVLVGVFYLAAYQPWGWNLLYTVLLFWATWHFVFQCYGLLRLYQRRTAADPQAPPDLAMRLESVALFAWVLFCLGKRLQHGPYDLFGWEVFHPNPAQVPDALVYACGGVSVASFVGALALHIARGARPFPWVRLLFVLTAFLGFYVPFNVVPHGTAGFAAAACWHGFQYIGIVRHFNRNKYAGKPAHGSKMIWWVSQPKRQALYFALLLAMAGSVYSVIYSLGAVYRDVYFWGGVVWVGLTFSHYWLDGVIWKFKRTNLAAQLAVNPQSAPAAAA